MIIEIESFNKNEDGVLLRGNRHTKYEIQQMIHAINQLTNDDFLTQFCNRFNFETIQNCKDLPDWVLDMETQFLYFPRIGEIYKAI